MSTTCSPVGVYLNCTVPRWTESLTKCHLISMCFDRSWNTGFSKSLMQLWLSHKIFVASILLLNRFTRNFLSHMAWHEAVLVAIYSASTELKATYLCFLLHQEVIPDTMLKPYPVVLFRSTELLAQTTPVNPLSLMSLPWVYISPCSIIPHIYLITCLAVAQSALFGSTMKWLRVLTA